MSYFPEVELNVMTLLEGERDPKRAIHQAEHFKKLRPELLANVIGQFAELLEPFA